MPRRRGGLRGRAERTVRWHARGRRRLPQHEPRWHASLAVLAAMLLYITLAAAADDRPDVGRAGCSCSCSWFRSRSWRRTGTGRRAARAFASILLIAIVNFFNLASVLLLIAGFFRPDKARDAHGRASCCAPARRSGSRTSSSLRCGTGSSTATGPKRAPTRTPRPSFATPTSSFRKCRWRSPSGRARTMHRSVVEAAVLRLLLPLVHQLRRHSARPT